MSDSSESSSSTSLVLDRFGRNLTAAMREGTLGHVIVGRGQERERVMQVLARREKNSPVLVGEPGVGKTSVVIGLAQRIVKGEVPETWRDKQLYVLDLNAAPTAKLGNQGDLQSFEDFLREIRTRKDIVLFIDELHRIAGAEESATDPASILKGMLARGELQVIGATTPDEYRKHVEKDAALEHRFQQIQVDEPTISHTIEILKALRDRYEAHHRVTITDDALVAAAQLADRYISDRFLPGKAIDLIDEASSRTRIRRITAQPDLRDFDEKITDVRREKESAIDFQDFEKAAALRDTEKQLIEKKDARRKEWNAGDMDTPAEVNEELIAEVLATATGIPVPELLESYVGIVPLSKEGDSGEADSTQTYSLLNDQPVDDVDGDLLRSSEVAADIASMLTASRAAAPLVMAVDAGWGMGKSTLLHQIESQLPGRPSVTPVRFNAWTAEGENALEGLIKSVLVELDSRVVRRWARKLGQQRNVLLIARIGFALVARFFGLARLVDELWSRLEVDAKSRNELRELIHNILSDWVNAKRDLGRTLVVFIDDLDRCSDDVIVKVCEAVKLYLDAPGLIFVIACDLSVLARGVARSAPDASSHGRIYLEKIVQVAYRLPPPEEAQIRRLIRGYALQSGTTGLIDHTATEMIAARAGRNPRRIKRIINSLVLEHRLNPAWRQAPLGSTHLLGAIMLQHLYAPFYDLMVAEDSGDDPIAEFLDYAEVCARAADPPPAAHPWWSTASRFFQKRGLPAPERSPATGERLTADLKRLEREAGITEELQALARDTSFIAMLRGLGGKETRQALRAQLVTRPLGTDRLPGEL